MDHRAIEFFTNAGHRRTLGDDDGKVALIVNTASECGFTPQYAELEMLHERYAKLGLTILAFPANNFGAQEPGSDSQIRAFCTLNYGVTFPLMAKVSVAGDDIHPLFKWLTEDSPFPRPIKWNFTKFLLGRDNRVAGRDSRVVGRFEPASKPLDDKITAAIERELSR